MNKDKKGFIAFDAVILGMIICIMLSFFIPKVKNAVTKYANRTSDRVTLYEQGTGSHFATNPSGSTGLNPDDYIVDGDILGDKIVTTQKIYFENPYPSVNTDEMITLTATTYPDDITDNTLTWKILSGNDLAYIIRSLDTKSVEITGIAPGRIILQAQANDASGKVAYAYIDVVRQPQSVTLDQNKINLSVSDLSENTKTVTATVLPDDTTNNYVAWSYADSTGSECTSFTTNGHSITVSAKKPKGISCNNVTVKIKAETSTPSIYTILEVVVTD